MYHQTVPSSIALIVAKYLNGTVLYLVIHLVLIIIDVGVLILGMYVDQVPRSDQRLVFHGTPNCLVGNLS